MKKLLVKTLEWILKKLTNGDLVKVTKQLVSNINDKNMTGAEKRAWVEKELKALFGEFSTFILNLAIEISVAVVKAQIGKLEIKK